MKNIPWFLLANSRNSRSCRKTSPSPTSSTTCCTRQLEALPNPMPWSLSNCLQWSPVPAEGMGLTPLGAGVVSSSTELRLLLETSSPLLEELLDTFTYMYYKRAIKPGETNLSWTSSCCTFLPLPLPRPVILLSSNVIQGSTNLLLCNNSKSELASVWKVLVHPYTINDVQLSRRYHQNPRLKRQTHLHNFRGRG